MAILSRPLTYDDLVRERETRDERLELIDGEIVVTPSPTPMHQLVVHRLAVIFDQAIVAAGAGLVLEAPLDVFLETHNVLQPDVIVLLRDRIGLFGPQMVESAPSLAVEVISPSTAADDRVRKRQNYARFGVPEYWLVDPDAQTVTIFSEPEGNQYRKQQTTSDVAVSATIPELSVDLRALFAPVPGF
jgi:Uma2 family endonuclease